MIKEFIALFTPFFIIFLLLKKGGPVKKKRIRFKPWQAAFVCCFFVYTGVLSSQDTIPPQIITPARDSSMACSNSPLILTALTNWYNAAGYAVAQDNSGQYTWQADKTLAQVLSIFITSSDTLCGNTKSVRVTFTAVDPSGNSSTPTSARFFTIDNTRPGLIVPPNVTVSCTPGIRDTLINWIRNKAGYIATDDCSNILTWTRFQYSISQGNTIIQTGGGNIQNGPYPTIPNGVCSWRLNINFWVVDECGNETVTFGTTSFSVVDDRAPVPVNPPPNITVSCEAIPAVPALMFADGCTFSPSVTFAESSTKDPDTLSCNHYRYQITRTWTASDACSNSTSYTQVIQVTDLTPPAMIASDSLTIFCSAFRPDSVYYTGIQDNCSPVVGFSATRQIEAESCFYEAVFTYFYEDICANKDTFIQHISIQADPIEWVRPPDDESYFCGDTMDMNALFGSWVANRAGSAAVVTCGDLSFFAAVSGSYNPLDTSTWPGLHPGNFDAQICPTPDSGFVRSEEVDFVYYNDCGQILVDRAIFGVRDTIFPVIQNCPTNIQAILPSDNCTTLLEIIVPGVTDDCAEATSPVIRTISAPVLSIDPNNSDSPVHPVELRLGPFNPASIIPDSDASILIQFRRIDMDDATEFFTIFDEDQTVLGRSPNTISECGDTEMTLTLPLSRLSAWIEDGYISIHFISNPVPGIPRAEINGFCGGSIRSTISFDIDLTNAIQVGYTLDGGDEVAVMAQDTLHLSLGPGSHELNMTYSDCALNQSTCTTIIEVVDETAPTMDCPENKTVNLPQGICSDTFALTISEIISLDACEGNFRYNRMVPQSSEASLITFLYNDNTGRHLARNKQFLFDDVFPILRKESTVKLTLEFNGNNRSTDEYFDLLAPDGSLIGSSSTRTNGDSCGFTSTMFFMNQETFNALIFNGQLSFTAVPNNSGNGINPCHSLQPNQTTDGISTLRLRLEYSDFAYAYQLSGATTSSLVNVPQEALEIPLILRDGITNIHLFTADAQGNKSNCSFQVTMVDVTPPVARCKNAAIQVHPSGIEQTTIGIDLIENNSTDDCSGLVRTLNPNVVDCSQADTDVNVTLTVEDEQGNKDSCIALVRVKPFELRPSFSSGLCENDTLKLFANIPPSSIPGTYTFHWKGPNNFEFFTENPSIPNVNELYNGTYTVTVTGFNQCKTEGSVIVNIQPLTKPSLTTIEPTLCEGSEVILNCTRFTGNITYDWYEGIAPTGVKIGTTTEPQLVLNALPGVHFYYVVATGEGCMSSPSNLLKVTIIGKPVAMIEQLFYSVCEGESITFRSTNSGNDLTYLWSGPNFVSTQKNPPPITDVSFANEGVYALVVARNGCTSDSATATVIILERPDKPIISSASVFCEGATFSLQVNNVTTGERYEWYQNGVLRFATTDNNLIIPNVQPNFEGSWHVVVFKGTCASLPSDQKAVAIDLLLEIGAINSGPICVGDSVQLMATFVPNATYTWESPNPQQMVPSIHNPKVLAIAGFYLVTITTPTGCQNNTETLVEIIIPPRITALSSDVSPCMDGQKPITFSPSVFPNENSYEYRYTSTSGFVSNQANAVLENPTQQDTGLYTLTVIYRGCPSEPFTIPVRFFMIPGKPMVEGLPYYCIGDDVVLQSSIVLTDDSASYIWSTPAGQIIEEEPNLLLGDAMPSLSGSYSVTLEENGCRSLPSEPFNLEVRPRPVLPGIRSNSPVCFGKTIALEADFADVVYSWFGPDQFTSNLSMPSIPSAREKHQGWYVLEVEKNGCTSARKDSVFVEVKPELSTPVLLAQRVFLCQTDGSRIEICVDPNSIQAGDRMAVVSATTLDTLAFFTTSCFIITPDWPGLVNGSNFLYVVVVNGACTSSPSNVVVLEFDAPPQFQAGLVQGDNLLICEESIVDLTASHGPPEIDVLWYGLTPNINFSNINLSNTSVSNLSPGENMIVLAYSYRGCSFFSTDTVTINVVSEPVAVSDAYTISFYTESSFEVLNNDQYFKEVTMRIVTQPTGGMARIENGQIVFTPDVNFIGDTRIEYEICSVVCPDFCSTSFVQIRVEAEKDCKPPTIITPNEDGINDAFIVPCLYGDQFPGNTLIIFNEWGNEVFSAKNYDNTWTAMYNGSPLPAGTYYYTLDLGNDNRPLIGFLILQR